MLPQKVSDLMLLKLNSKVVAKFKERHKLEAKVTAGQVKDLIRVDLEAMMNPEEEDFEAVFIEDLEVEGEVTLMEVGGGRQVKLELKICKRSQLCPAV